MNIQASPRPFPLLAAIAVIGLAGIGHATLGMAASFDCAKAKTEQEKLICGAADLSQLDERGAGSCAAALAATPDKNLVKTWQRDWLRSSRNGCTDVECLRGIFSLHNRELEEFAEVASAGPTEISIGRNALTVEEVAGSQCGGMNVTFAGEYRRNGATR